MFAPTAVALASSPGQLSRPDPCSRLVLQLVSQLAGILAAVEVAYLGVMWQETGDLAAPIVAALAASAVDFYHIRRSIAPPAAQ